MTGCLNLYFGAVNFSETWPKPELHMLLHMLSLALSLLGKLNQISLKIYNFFSCINLLFLSGAANAVFGIDSEFVG